MANNVSISINKSIFTSNLQSLRNYVMGISDSRYTDRYLNVGMDIIDQSAFFLKLSNSIKSEALEVYQQLCSRGIARGRSLRLIAITSIYIVCRKHYLPITISDIALVTDNNKKEIAKTLRIILQKAKVHLPSLKPGVFIERYSKEVDALPITQKLAESMLNLAYERHIVAGRDPTTIAAALIYSAGCYTGDCITQDNLSKKALVTPVSIRNYIKYFSQHVDKLTVENLLTLVNSERKIVVDDEQKVWNKYLVTFMLKQNLIEQNKAFDYAFSNLTFPDAKFSQIYLEKSSITQNAEESIGITLTLWVNVSVLFSYTIPQDLNFRINEVYGSEAILQVDTKFLDSINAESSEIPSFIDSSQIWNELKGDQISNLSTDFPSQIYHPSSTTVNMLTSDFSDIVEFYRTEKSNFDQDLIKKSLIAYQDKNDIGHLIEKCRESYYSNDKDRICFSLSIISVLSRISLDFSWRRNVADDLFQIYQENEDKDIDDLIEANLISLKYEETYSYEEILSVLDLGIEESNMILTLREKPGDLYQIAKNQNISEVKVRKIIDWLLREGYVVREWEGLSLSYSAIPKEELLNNLRDEYKDEWGCIPLP